MFIPEGILLNGIEVFLLVFVRMTGLFVIAPIFGRRNIPAYFKIGFSFLLALMLVNSLQVDGGLHYSSVFEYFLLVLKEFLVGITLGYVSYAIFTAIYLAGQLIDMKVGFGIVNVVDPLSNIQVPITSTFYFIFCMMIFLICNGHHILIRALFYSYEFVPLGLAIFEEELVNDVIRVFGNIFLVGFKISGPVVAAILIADVALGVISKTVPQLNVFIVGMPLKIFLGLSVMMLTVPIFVSVLESLIKGMDREMYNFLESMAPK
ncbi:flagellar biosynthetic protein FliR [Herbivorax sp. ANBcel31]|uniref:flagellar biosynthetic protein FliR n=1 Tax=Herbivorax sp. ANBcel31 TaxID=3069754 RepID=UPI0027B401E3|nr:flagellar biosynthetic protein FliR [Herbivorax sp. ANBcel31]MDQ2085879.1 flagellar biosynthetic protein FliR [Herbivorax sp. ANBcel31]